MTHSRLRQAALAGIAAALWLGSATPAGAQRGVFPIDPPVLRLCPPTGECRYYPHRIVIQGNALGRTANIVPDGRGLRWPTDAGYVSLAVPRPLDYRGGSVRVGVFYYIGGDTEHGTVGMNMRPVQLVPGGGYETYGAVSTPVAVANSDTHYEQWVTISNAEIGFNGSGVWWNVEIARQGTFAGPLNLLTVLVEYR